MPSDLLGALQRYDEMRIKDHALMAAQPRIRRRGTRRLATGVRGREQDALEGTPERTPRVGGACPSRRRDSREPRDSEHGTSRRRRSGLAAYASRRYADERLRRASSASLERKDGNGRNLFDLMAGRSPRAGARRERRGGHSSARRRPRNRRTGLGPGVGDA